MNDTVDDLHYAEDTAAVLAASLQRALSAVEAPGDIGDEYGFALDAAAEAVHAWSSYCRPTCGFRDSGTCSSDDPDCCGCPCDHSDLYSRRAAEGSREGTAEVEATSCNPK